MKILLTNLFNYYQALIDNKVNFTKIKTLFFYIFFQYFMLKVFRCYSFKLVG